MLAAAAEAAATAAAAAAAAGVAGGGVAAGGVSLDARLCIPICLCCSCHSGRQPTMFQPRV